MKTQNQFSVKPKWLIIKLTLLILLPLFGGKGWSQSDQSPTQTVCQGNEPYLVTATAGSNYNWSITPGTSGNQWRINGTGNSISVDWNIRGVYTLSVIETNNQGCSGLPVSVVVTVNPIPDVDDPSDQTTSNGSATSAVNFTGSIPGTIYNWINNTPSIGLSATGSGSISSFTAVNNGSSPIIATITVTPSYTNAGRLCTGAPQSFTITVNPSTSMNPVADASYCKGSVTTPIVFTSPVAGTTFRWTNTNTSIGLGASGTGNLPSFTAANTGTAPAVANITVTPSVGNIAGSPITFIITVNPLPVPTITPSVNPVCFGTGGVVYSTEPGMTNYVWTVTGGLITAGGTAADNTVTVTWNGSSPYSVHVNYTNANGCTSANPVTFNVTVTPVPVTSPIFHN